MNNKTFCPSNFALLIGIDWADRKHDFCETLPDGTSPTYGTIDSTPEAIDAWVHLLSARFPDQKIAVSCELRKGSLVHALMKYLAAINCEHLPSD